MREIVIAFAAFAFVSTSEARAETLNLEPYIEGTGLVVATVAIDGQPARMLLDTGAGVTLATPQFAAGIGCAPYGALSGFRMRGDRLDLQKCGEHMLAVGGRVMRRDIGVLDLAPLLGPDAPPLDGIMGLDVFDGRLITLSLADRRLFVDERPGRGWSEGVVRFQRETGGAGLSIFVRVQAQTGTLWMLLDSGTVGTVAFLSPGAMEQLGLAATDTTAILAISGAGAHSVRAERAEGLLYDGVLGERFLRDFDIAVDFRRGRIWWRPHTAGE